MMTEAGVRRLLKQRIKTEHASMSDFARWHSISLAYVADVKSGRAKPGKRLLYALRLKRVVGYVEMK